MLAKGLLTLAVQSDVSVFPLTLDPSNSSEAIPLSEVRPLPKPLGLSILRNRQELLDGLCNPWILLPVCLVAHPTPRHKWRSVFDTQLPWWCSMVSDRTCNASRLNRKVFLFPSFPLGLRRKDLGKGFCKISYSFPVLIGHFQ